jgi:hypothetical protein
MMPYGRLILAASILLSPLGAAYAEGLDDD